MIRIFAGYVKSFEKALLQKFSLSPVVLDIDIYCDIIRSRQKEFIAEHLLNADYGRD
jgi:hypothetical protein